MTVDDVAEVRAFNRRWTEVLGLLDRHLLDTDHTLAEARVLFELNGRSSWERLDLRARLGMDPSFLTRVLSRLEAGGLVVSEPSAVDGRRRRVALTGAGRAAAAELDLRSTAQITALLRPLDPLQRQTLVDSLGTAAQLVAPADEPTVTVRHLAIGDRGWMVQRNAEVYAAEFGWDETYEALVARIVADFQANSPDGREAGVDRRGRRRAGRLRAVLPP